MAKYYTPSTGKVIDMPSTMAGGVGSEVPAGMATGITGTTQPTQAGGGFVGGNEQLFNILMMLGLGKAGTTTGGRILQQAQYFKPPEASETEKTKATAKETADRIVNLLEDNYYGGQKAPKLAYGRIGGMVETLNSKIGRNPDLNAYLALRNSVRPTLVKAMGDVGNFSAVEQQWAISNVPTATNTPQEAQRYFRDLRKKLALPEKTYLGPKMPSSWQSE